MSLIPAEDVLIARSGVLVKSEFLSWCADFKAMLFVTVSITENWDKGNVEKLLFQLSNRERGLKRFADEEAQRWWKSELYRLDDRAECEDNTLCCGVSGA